AMRRWIRIAAPLLVALSVAAVAYQPSASAAAQNATHHTKSTRESVSVMPMGDSITGSTGCWRALLWTKLKGSGRGSFDFEGESVGPECDSVFDDDAVAYSGTRVVDMTPKDEFLETLSDTGASASIALMHLGSNDIRDDKSINDILDGYTTVVGLLRKANPDAIILVAQLIPITESPMDENCPQCPEKIRELNAEIPGWAARMGTKLSPITVVDQHEGFDPEADTSDGLHPDDSGSEKIAGNWYDALEKVIDGM
ncbi:MAG: SGNH/GDSL hydrolase family protein, partial [Stackebrandtia sp.]